MDTLEKTNVLLVDDRPENLMALETILAELGQNMVEATSGEEALRQLLKMDFAVILLDVQMPGMDGFEVASAIRERDRSRDTPIIFLTAMGRSDEQIRRGYSLGAVDYILKPFVPEILRWKVAVLVSLYQKTAELRAQLEENRRLNRELELANKELEAFSYSVSHDLRAPLRSLSGFSKALIEDYGGRLDDTASHYLDRIAAASERMDGMITALLNLSRVTRHEMRRTAVDASSMAEDIAAELQESDPSRDAEFIVEPGAVVDADAHLLRVALENLLGNAWKFTAKRDRARVEFGTTNAGEQQACFVRDNGAGFDMTYAEKLFGAFQRLHSQSEFSGHGIGLATVQRIIHRHGGRIWAQGEVGKGATFFFTLAPGG
ncbi:MAG: response regulator [Acidobacteriota bacterium]